MVSSFSDGTIRAFSSTGTQLFSFSYASNLGIDNQVKGKIKNENKIKNKIKIK